MIIGIVNDVDDRKYSDYVLKILRRLSFKEYMLPYTDIEENTKLHLLYFRLRKERKKCLTIDDIERHIDDVISYDKDNNDDIMMLRHNRLKTLLRKCHEEDMIILNLTLFEGQIVEDYDDSNIVIYICYDEDNKVSLRRNIYNISD